ncbi:hypothetical protein ABBQ32_010617 [Trebouxia sp. C0010 RCD-2024]
MSLKKDQVTRSHGSSVEDPSAGFGRFGVLRNSVNHKYCELSFSQQVICGLLLPELHGQKGLLQRPRARGRQPLAGLCPDPGDAAMPPTAACLASQQAAALYQIKKSIDPRNQLSDWQSGAPNACSFSGVTCNSAQEVTELGLGGAQLAFIGLREDRNVKVERGNKQPTSLWNLAGKDLGGSLPQDASAYTPLATLTLLDLSTNQLTGPLPPLGSLTALQTLELMDNSFTGPLPELSGFRNLTVINFQDNQFSGTLPSSWSTDYSLQSIIVALSKVTGTLPDSWSQLTALVNLDLRSNELSGPVPHSWRGSAAPGVLPTSGMTSLVTLGLGGNAPLCAQGTPGFSPPQIYNAPCVVSGDYTDQSTLSSPSSSPSESGSSSSSSSGPSPSSSSAASTGSGESSSSSTQATTPMSSPSPTGGGGSSSSGGSGGSGGTTRNANPSSGSGSPGSGNGSPGSGTIPAASSGEYVSHSFL